MTQILYADGDDGPTLLQIRSGDAALFSREAPERQGPNEDTGAVFIDGADNVLLVVADGVGGNPHGSVASRRAVEIVGQAFLEADDPDLLRVAVLDGIERANVAVREIGGGAACTIALVGIAGRVARPYHVGDSMALVVGQRGRLKHQTIPHGPTGYAVESGLLDEQEAIHHEERHVVSNVVGISNMHIDVGPSLALAPHDTVLVGTDGLFDNMLTQEIIEVIRKGPLDDAAGALMRRCRQRMVEPSEGEPSKPDDITFVLFRRSAAPRSKRRRPSS